MTKARLMYLRLDFVFFFSSKILALKQVILLIPGSGFSMTKGCHSLYLIEIMSKMKID